MSNHIQRSYLPYTETEAYLWLTNLAAQLPGIIANALGITPTQTNALLKATQLLTDAYRWQEAAHTLAGERTSNKNEAAWNPLGQTVYIRPNPADTGPASLLQAEAGAFPLAIQLCDEILLNKTNRLDQAIKDALRLNPLPKHPPAPGAKPQYTAAIEAGRLTVRLTKAAYQYFIVKIDHGDGHFDEGHIMHESPYIDPAPLPTADPQMWRVQAYAYAKGNPVGLPGDIIDVAAKAYTAEHSEGTA
jgi:hypothetical protein